MGERLRSGGSPFAAVSWMRPFGMVCGDADRTGAASTCRDICDLGLSSITLCSLFTILYLAAVPKSTPSREGRGGGVAPAIVFLA